MNIPTEFILAVWSTIISIAGAIVAFIVKGIKADIKTANDRSSECKLDIALYRAHVSENYCDKPSMQSTLERIHNRMDGMADDIKKILGKVG